MLTLLISLAPLITNLGLKLIEWFEKDQQKQLQAQSSFLNLLAAHILDAQKNVNAKLDYQAQVDQLKLPIESGDKK